MTAAHAARPSPFHVEIPAPAPVRGVLNGALDRLLGLARLNAAYAAIPDGTSPAGFACEALRALRVEFDVADEDVARIPRKGALVVVANHPYGAVEGLILLRLLATVRPDVRVLANRLLGRIPELRPLLLDVDVFGGEGAAASNRAPLRAGIRHLRAGGVLALFPAGEVAHVRRGEGVVDPPWRGDAALFVRRGGADALPVRFEGTNGALFQAAGMVHPSLRTALLPRELLNKADRRIAVRVGAPVQNARLAEIGSDDAVTAFLRLRTDLLARRSASAAAGVRTSSDGVPVAPPEEPAALAAEIAALPPERKVAENGTLAVHVLGASEAPAVMRELGRLREITFREVGEGTGLARDLDRFDEHYRHLVLWDRAAGEVAGAYRFARTTEVLPARGATGLYTTTLFRLGPGFFERLGPAVELGRSFVAPAWQRSFSPLMLLWKAIGTVVLEQPDCRTLFGPVSISQRYAPFARHLMVEWLRLRAPATAFEPLSAPLRPVRGPAADVRRARAAAATLPDVDALSDAVADMEPALRGVPILVREYLRLSGRFASFSVDPEFGGVVDGLVVIDLTTTERRILARYMGRDGADRFLANAASRDAAPAPGA